LGGGKAGIELDRFLKLLHRAIGAARPHADETERKMGVGISGVQSDRALRQLVAFGITGVDILRPAEIGGIADRDR